MNTQNIEAAFAAHGLELILLASNPSQSTSVCGNVPPLARWCIEIDAQCVSFSSDIPELDAIYRPLSDLQVELLDRWTNPPQGEFDEEEISALYALPSGVEALRIDGGLERGRFSGSLAYYHWQSRDDAKLGLLAIRRTRSAEALRASLDSITRHVATRWASPQAAQDIVDWVAGQCSADTRAHILSQIAAAAGDAAKSAARHYISANSTRISAIRGIAVIDEDDEPPSVSVPSVQIQTTDGESVWLLVLEDALDACAVSNINDLADDWDWSDGTSERQHQLDRLGRFFGVNDWSQYWAVLYRLLEESRETVEIAVVGSLQGV